MKKEKNIVININKSFSFVILRVFCKSLIHIYELEIQFKVYKYVINCFESYRFGLLERF
jgi:hypothetical protein